MAGKHRQTTKRPRGKYVLMSHGAVVLVLPRTKASFQRLHALGAVAYEWRENGDEIFVMPR